MEMERNQMRYEIHVNYGDGRGWMVEGTEEVFKTARDEYNRVQQACSEEDAADVRLVQYKMTVIARVSVGKRRAKK